MTFAVNPIFKSCGFLGIDFYEEVSDTFEENISDALIPETSVLSVNNYLKNIKVPGKKLWKEFHPDTEFLLDEAKKLEDFSPGSIQDIKIPNPLINFNNDFERKFSDEIPLEENNERSFMSDELFLGHCPLIEVPFIPFTLLKYKPKLLPLSKLLETLPVMEIEDIFDDDVIDYSFQNIDISLLESTEDLITKQPFSDEIELKELPLPEFPLKKSSDYVRDIENVTWNDDEFMECVQNTSEDNLPSACSSQNTARKSQEFNSLEKSSFEISFGERCIATKTFLSPSPHAKDHEENETLKSASQNACKKQISQEQTADHLKLQSTHENKIILKQSSPYNSSPQNALENYSIQKPVIEKALDHSDLQNACENRIIQKPATGQVSNDSEQSIFEKHGIQNPAAVQAPDHSELQSAFGKQIFQIQNTLDHSESQSAFEKQIFHKQNTLDHSESQSAFGKQISPKQNTLDHSESQSAFGKQISPKQNTLDHSESQSQFEKQIFGKQNTLGHSESQSAFGKQIFQKSYTELASDCSELQSLGEWQVFSKTSSQSVEHPELKIKYEKHVLSKPISIQTPKHSQLCENSEISQTKNVNLSNPSLSKDINAFQNKFNLRDSTTSCPLLHSADLKICCQTLLSNNDQCYDSNSTSGDEAKCYLQKLSDLKLKAAVKNRCLVDTSTAFRSNNNRENNIGEENTVFHNNKESKGVAFCTSGESVAKDVKSSTPKRNISKSVNLLSSFLTAKSMKNFRVDSLPSPVLKDNFKKHSAATSSSTILSNLQNEHHRDSIEPTAKHEFADLQVVLSGDYMTVVRMYECSAIPILSYLLQFGLFPLSLTVADVPSYKTCFLLNQEVKRCRDNNINPMSSEKGDYYRYLLALHGLLKSFELVRHFDAKLALSCLIDFKKCHASLMKGCYDDLVKQLNDILPELYVNHLIHPKLKTLCQFLKEKYYFCEENRLHFKTLIILKRNLNTFYTSLENVLKDSLSLSTFLVPESVLLQDSTSVFREEDKSVFVVSASSLSKDIPWKDLTLVIEYEYDSDSMWKRMCEEQNVPHLFVKLAPLPLKTFDQIKSYHALEKSVFNQKKFTIIVSSTTPSELHLLPLLKSKGTISFYIRDYGAFLPHLYFTDIVVDERTAIVLPKDLSSIHAAENVYHQLTFLYLKYEMCWIIILETIDVENVLKLYWSAFELCKKYATCKFKIVFAQNVMEMADLIECILSTTARSSSKFKSSSSCGLTFEEEMTKEELFLVSFPSLNPFVVNLMLSENRLPTLLTLDFAHLAESFPSVPERFLRCFHSSLNKECIFPGTPQSTVSNTPCSSEDDEPSQSSFNFSPNLQDTSEYESDDRGMDVEEVNLDVQRLCNEPYMVDRNSNDPFLEVDLGSNVSSDEYNESNSYPSPSEERCLKIASLNKMDECLGGRDFSLQGLSTFSDTQRKRHNFENTIESIMSPDLVSQKSNLDVCFYPNDPLLSFKQHAKEPVKRKCTPEDPELLCLKKSCRVQKGMRSKSVTKRDLYLHSPSGSCHSREPVSEQTFSSDHSRFSHYFSPPRQYEANRRCDPYTSASQSIHLTPRTTRKLAYEGARGQTRLVFL